MSMFNVNINPKAEPRTHTHTHTHAHTPDSPCVMFLVAVPGAAGISESS